MKSLKDLIRFESFPKIQSMFETWKFFEKFMIRVMYDLINGFYSKNRKQQKQDISFLRKGYRALYLCDYSLAYSTLGRLTSNKRNAVSRKQRSVDLPPTVPEEPKVPKEPRREIPRSFPGTQRRKPNQKSNVVKLIGPRIKPLNWVDPPKAYVPKIKLSELLPKEGFEYSDFCTKYKMFRCAPIGSTVFLPKKTGWVEVKLRSKDHFEDLRSAYLDFFESLEWDIPK